MLTVPASPFTLAGTISRGLKSALGTGNWGERDAPSKTGVSQALNRLTYASSLSHLRRCNTSFGKDSKLARPRQLHNTQWGMICPAETPEGAQVFVERTGWVGVYSNTECTGVLIQLGLNIKTGSSCVFLF